MHRHPRLASASALFLASALLAQTPAKETETAPRRSYVLVQDSALQQTTFDWRQGGELLRYAKAHPGTYLVFSDQGTLYRLDNADRLAEIRSLYAPMQPLAEKQQGLAKAQSALATPQRALAKEQRPLADQQRKLAEQQRSSTPQDQVQIGQAQAQVGQEQADLGRVQGQIGSQQGDLGQIQGELGRQQAEIARTADRRVQTILATCLADGTCPRIPS
jgi:hypothetical protein